MHTKPQWEFDEMNITGTDYRSRYEVETYDRRHQTFRNADNENQLILELLKLNPGQKILDIGCGTGNFAIAAAISNLEVYAIDISAQMLIYARDKANLQGIDGIKFNQAGFLTYKPNIKFDAVVTQLALHHLPDFWKQVAIIRIYEMLNEGGKLFLRDLIYSFDVKNYYDFFEDYILKFSDINGKDISSYTITHIRNEYSTLNWIMEGIIERGGFSIDKSTFKNGFDASYLCTRRP